MPNTELYQCARCGHLTEAPAGLEKVRCQDCDRQDYGAPEALRLWNDSVARNRTATLREVTLSFLARKITRKQDVVLLTIATLLACSCSFDLGSLQGGPADADGAGSGPAASDAGTAAPDSGPPRAVPADAGAGDAGGRTGAGEAGAASPDSLPRCQPMSTGGLACPGGKCTLDTYGGSSFAATDGLASTICLSASSLCAAGTTNSLESLNDSSNWGATFGFYLRPESTPESSFEVQLTGTGVSVTLSSLPTGAQARVQLTTGNLAYSIDYCATLTSASQVVPWRSFNTVCSNGSGLSPSDPPADAKSIAVQVASEAGVAGTFDLCVTSLTL